MDFAHAERALALQEQLTRFMDEHVYPAEPVYARQRREGDPNVVPAVVEELKTEGPCRGPVEPLPAGRGARPGTDEPRVRAAR